MAAHYPKRVKFSAHKIVRLLGKTCAAQEIGATGVFLVTWVAMTEDAAGYKRAVTFFDAQLMPIVGVTSQKSLANARDKAVAAGWLHYEYGAKGRAGRYWATIPDHASGVDDMPSDEGHDNAMTIRGECAVNNTAHQGENRGQSYVELGGESGTKLHGNGQPFFPVPVPDPSISLSVETTAANPDDIQAMADGLTFLTGLSPRGERFRQAYCKKTDANEIDDAIDGQIALLNQRQGWDDNKAFEFLLAKAIQYSSSKIVTTNADRRTIPSPARWLSQGKYLDDPAEWDIDAQQLDTKRNGRTNGKSRRNPDAKPSPTVSNGDSDLDALIERVVTSKPATAESAT